MTSYAGVHHDVEAPIAADNHGVLFLNSHVRYEDVTDGTSQTLFVGEKLDDGLDLGWASGTASSLRNTGSGNRTPGPGAGEARLAGPAPRRRTGTWPRWARSRVRRRLRQPASRREQLPLRRRLGAVRQVDVIAWSTSTWPTGPMARSSTRISTEPGLRSDAGCADRRETTNHECEAGLHPDRAARRDGHHRHPDRLPPARACGAAGSLAEDQCVNNLKQIGLALHATISHNTLPSGCNDTAGRSRASPAATRSSWIGLDPPYMEQNGVYHAFDFRHGAGDPENQTAGTTRIACLSARARGRLELLLRPLRWRHPFATGSTSYAGCQHDVEAPIDADNHGVFYLNSRVRFVDVSDGLSQTIFVGEMRARPRWAGCPGRGPRFATPAIRSTGDHAVDPRRPCPPDRSLPETHARRTWSGSSIRASRESRPPSSADSAARIAATGPTSPSATARCGSSSRRSIRRSTGGWAIAPTGSRSMTKPIEASLARSAACTGRSDGLHPDRALDGAGRDRGPGRPSAPGDQRRAGGRPPVGARTTSCNSARRSIIMPPSTVSCRPAS